MNEAAVKTHKPPRAQAGQAFRHAFIDPSAIRHNVAHLKALAGVDEFIAVVKADGYGHGAVHAATAAIEGGATRIGVADLQEAMRLIRAGIHQVPILAWLHPPGASFHEAAEAGVELGVWSEQQLESAADAAASGRPTQVHVKVETGLGRGGAPPANWSRLFACAHELETAGLISVVGIFSHLSGASARDDLSQLDVFDSAARCAADAGVFPPLLHLAATAATLSLPTARLNAVRVGVGIYGLSPLADRTAADLGLRPAMTLQAPVVAVRRVPEGQGVSYGYDYRTAQESTLVLISLGYADGLPRQASGKARVLINGCRYPIAGRIAMDQIVVDVADNEVKLGDMATVFGDPAEGAPSADDWAEAAGTINYEIVTRIGSRVERDYG